MLKHVICFIITGLIIVAHSTAEAASNYLSRRELVNQIEITGGARRLVNAYDELNRIKEKSISGIPCGNIRYRRYIFDTFALGISGQFCTKKLSYVLPGVPVSEIHQTISGATLDFVFSLPLKQRVIGGPFAAQSFELGYGLSLGQFQLDYTAVEDKEYKQKTAGGVVINSILFDLGGAVWGLKVNVNSETYFLTDFEERLSPNTTKKEINNSQKALKIDLGVRYSF